jgi:4a-hydroxytetrahydrobiopterin dehydratase
MAPAVAREWLGRVEGWELVEERRIARSFRCQDWKSAQAFVVAVGDVAEGENHHPDLDLAWGRVDVEIWTHKIGGLTESDFVLAAKIDRRAQSAVGRK